MVPQRPRPVAAAGPGRRVGARGRQAPAHRARPRAHARHAPRHGRLVDDDAGGAHAAAGSEAADRARPSPRATRSVTPRPRSGRSSATADRRRSTISVRTSATRRRTSTWCSRGSTSSPTPDRPVADVLLDQRIAAGVGNVFKSEALFVVGIHPLTPIGALDAATRRRLWTTAHRQLRANARPGPAPDDGDRRTVSRSTDGTTAAVRVATARSNTRRPVRAGRRAARTGVPCASPRLPSLTRWPIRERGVSPSRRSRARCCSSPALAAVTGCLDAVSLARTTRTFVGFQTGNLVLVGLGVGRGHFAAAAGPAVAVVAFLIGSALTPAVLAPGAPAPGDRGAPAARDRGRAVGGQRRRRAGRCRRSTARRRPGSCAT